ncbi:MAG TPA: hypothetical protein VN345_14970 [Blastocatellia bacterium]|nr:hypothetical protein [Blastocatellia bacterium]
MQPKDPNDPALTAKQEIAIAALISTNTIKQAAAAASVSEVTLWRWMKQPEFKKAYREARWKAVQQAITKLQHSTSSAATVLQQIADNDKIDPRCRVYASRAIFQNAFKGIDLEDHEERLDELEATARDYQQKEDSK